MAQVPAQRCSLCDKNHGVYYCYECQHALCTVCRKNHGKILALSGHTVADINRIDRSNLNKKNRCVTHNKDVQFYCTECSILICSKCVTSTHKSHAISDITDVVLEERENAKENIKKMKLKTEAISSLQEKIRRGNIAKLHVESEKCKRHIESVCKDLQSFIEVKGSIKTTEVEDNEAIENQNFEAFLENTYLVKKQYVKTLSELENLLLEKHDVTFYLGYKSIQRNIQTLVSIPDEPPFERVPRFEEETLYRDVLDNMEAKMKKSLCPICSVQKKQIEDLQSEYNISKETFHREIEKKNDDLQKLSKKIQSLKGEVLQLKKSAERVPKPLPSTPPLTGDISRRSANRIPSPPPPPPPRPTFNLSKKRSANRIPSPPPPPPPPRPTFNLSKKRSAIWKPPPPPPSPSTFNTIEMSNRSAIWKPPPPPPSPSTFNTIEIPKRSANRITPPPPPPTFYPSEIPKRSANRVQPPPPPIPTREVPKDIEKKNVELRSKTSELAELKWENGDLFKFKCSQPNHCRRCGEHVPFNHSAHQSLCRGRKGHCKTCGKKIGAGAEVVLHEKVCSGY